MAKLGILQQSDFNKLMVNFLLTEPFFASIMRLIRKRRTIDGSIPTAGVCVENGGFTMYWNPEFIAKLVRIQEMAQCTYIFISFEKGFGTCVKSVNF